LNAVTK